MATIDKLEQIIDNWDKLSKKASEKQINCYNNGIEDWQYLIKEAPETIDTMPDIVKFVEQVYPLLINTKKGKKITGRKNVKKTRKTFTIKGKKHVNELKRKKAKKTKEPKKSKTTKASKEPKPKKPTYKNKPNWYKTIESFVKSAKKGSCMTYTIKNQLSNLQDRFDAKRNLNTPHIEIIREIQDKLLPYANKDTKRVDLPKWDSFVDKCKEALKTITISKKGTKEDYKSTSLAGCRTRRKTTHKRRR